MMPVDVATATTGVQSDTGVLKEKAARWPARGDGGAGICRSDDSS